MIVCKNGHPNPDGATYCAVCKEYIDASAQPAPATPPAPPTQVTLTPAALTAEAGGEADGEVGVENNGEADDDYVLELTGQAAGFGSLVPAGLTLARGAAGTSRLVFRPDAKTTGELGFDVIVHSSRQPEQQVSAHGTLTVSAPAPAPTPTPTPAPPPAPALAAELSPRTSTGGAEGKHVLTIRNEGTAPETASTTAASPDAALAIEVQPSTLTIPAGGSATADVRVRPGRRRWLGRTQTHPFQLTVTPPALTLEGAMNEKPRVPLALLLVLVLAAVAAVALIAYLASRDGGGSSVCGGAQLAGQVLDSTGAAGSSVESITLGNTSSTTCTMEGFPNLQLEDSGGAQLPTNVEHGGGIANFQQPVTTVSLAPGGVATLLVSHPNVPTGDETCPKAAALLIQPPGSSGVVRVSMDIAPCGGRLNESPILPGVVHAP
jgi:hypothetical protein